jgi:hypothetical protein
LTSYEYKVKKRIYSGICMCGCSHLSHHGQVVSNPYYTKETGESVLPGACLTFGFNENEGKDEKGREHCMAYVDRDNPDDGIREHWSGTVRHKKASAES